MTTQDTKLPTDPEQANAQLRQRAEEALRKNADVSPKQLERMTPEEIQRKLHDLQVHQLELEMQNVELRRAQAELNAARNRYFELYDLAPVGYCTLSEAGLILEANLSVAALLGVSKGTLQKQPISRYILPEDQDIYYLHRKQLFETGAPQMCELRIVNTSGVPCWVRLNTNLAEDETGAPACRVVLSDITERKEVEEEKAKVDAQFQQAQKMESIGRLAGGVAHDFNNKLTIILGFAEIVMEKIDQSDSIYADMKEIHDAAQHSAILTRQLLAFARKQMAVPKVLDLNDTVTGMLNMLVRLIGENINLSWLPQTGLWPVKIDPSQLEQILVNLCVNARDAIASVGKITITSENVVMDDAYCDSLPGSIPGEYVLMTVSDNGCGMNKETLEKIFEPFFTTKEVDLGTGLGLATVYGVVKQNNGFVYAESDGLESGTSIKIFLPRHGETVSEIQEGSLLERTQQGCGTILLVEDEEKILQMIAKMLQSLGFVVLTANSPSEAINIARDFSGRINLIMTDMIMPEMNGRDLAERILSFSPQLKFLFMSGYSSTHLSQQGKIEPNIHFMQKPFTRNELDSKVRRALKS
ncbi:PAS domain-containing sensor histidine kinase [Desulfopila sp. IMCC35008]|uniref:hybrid sensor histidine kinase/response regulator n=1 Tax=Desulfopila sp. IMCC35008 TaxID=2653858 RepID=UPI0013D29A78|nr:PAS domain-containing sensor histidine kinase [Desulfopila sp. IMCC35008]